MSTGAEAHAADGHFERALAASSSAQSLRNCRKGRLTAPTDEYNSFGPSVLGPATPKADDMRRFNTHPATGLQSFLKERGEVRLTYGAGAILPLPGGASGSVNSKAIAAQLDAVSDANWCHPWGKPLSNVCGCTGTARVGMNQEPPES